MMTVFNSGELVVKPNTRGPGGSTAEPPIPAAPALVPAVAPGASLVDIDAAIAARRARVVEADATIANLQRRLTAPAVSRIKTLLAGKAEDRDVLKQDLADAHAQRARLESEIAELEQAKAPFHAAADCFRFDSVLRPKLRAALTDLAKHLTAAAQVYADSGDLLREAESLHGGALARGCIAGQRGADLPAPDRRELTALAFWRREFTGERPNRSRLCQWFDELTAAGIDLKVKR